MPIHALLHIVQQQHLALELLANLLAELSLPPDTRAQHIQLLVLLAQHLAVVRVDLLVVEIRVVGRGVGVGVVAVWEELCAVGIRRIGCVGEADGFGFWGLGLGGCEVALQGGVVGVCECG